MGEIVEICVLLSLVISQSWDADCCLDSSGQLACVYHCEAWTRHSSVITVKCCCQCHRT